MTDRQALISRLLAEAGVILVLAIMVGVGWNFRLLENAWSGTATTVTSATSAEPRMAIPLPLGLVQVKELFDSKEASIIDARDRNAFAAGHIKGAISLPLPDAAAMVPEFSSRVPKSAILVIYCNGYSCEDSVELGKLLLAAGYSTVYYFDGGLPAWRDANYPMAVGKQ
jgi:rhodanese-related sulfurtransferase